MTTCKSFTGGATLDAQHCRLRKRNKPAFQLGRKQARPVHRMSAAHSRKLTADMAHIAGPIAAGVLRNPFDDGFHVFTTTTHKTLRGPRGGMLLCKEEHAENIDKAVFPGLQGGPHMHTITGIAVALAESDTPEFIAYAEQIIKKAKRLAEKLLE